MSSKTDTSLKAALAAAAEAERFEAEVIAKREEARRKADALRRIAEQQRDDRQRAWAETVLNEVADHRQALAVRIEDAKRTFELTAVEDFPSAGRAFLDWYDAFGEQHVAELDAHRAAQILNRPGYREPTATPHLSFADEISRALTHAGWTALESRQQAAADRRARIFNGEDES